MTLHYFTDPLCGWCYGFSSSMKQFYEAHKHELDLEIVCGGMVKGEHEKPIGDMAPYLKKAYKRVEETTGVQFGEAFLQTLDDGTTFYSSVPSSIAMVVFRSYQTGFDLEYLADLQKAIYYDGIDPADQSHFAKLAAEYGLDQRAFEAKMQEDLYKQETYSDFSVTQQFKVGGYPTLILHARDEYFLLTKGYSKTDQLEKTYQSILHSIHS